MHSCEKVSPQARTVIWSPEPHPMLGQRPPWNFKPQISSVSQCLAVTHNIWACVTLGVTYPVAIPIDTSWIHKSVRLEILRFKLQETRTLLLLTQVSSFDFKCHFDCFIYFTMHIQFHSIVIYFEFQDSFDCHILFSVVWSFTCVAFLSDSNVPDATVYFGTWLNHWEDICMWFHH